MLRDRVGRETGTKQFFFRPKMHDQELERVLTDVCDLFGTATG